jgi:hypothetical protein
MPAPLRRLDTGGIVSARYVPERKHSLNSLLA